MSDDLWRWADPNGQQRRVRFDELRSSLASGVLAPNTPVWKPGWKAWQPAHDVPELTGSAMSAANGVVLNIPPPPLAILALQHDFENKTGGSFSPPPMPVASANEEPPPPPAYVPAAVKKAGPPPGVLASAPTALPTTIGLPPPPELAALTKGRAASNRPPPLPMAPPPVVFPPQPPPKSDSSMIEEVSGSMLLDDASSPNGALPPPTNPIVHSAELAPDVDVPGVGPRRSPLTSLYRDIEEIRAGRPPKNKPKLIAAGVITLAVVVLALALFVSLLRACFGSSDTDKPIASASAPLPSGAIASASAAPQATAPVTAVAAPASGPVFGDCTSLGEPRALGWRAVVGGGLETAPVSGGAIAVGFASSPRDAVAVAVDPTTLATSGTARAKAAGDIKRATPTTNGKLGVIADADRRGDKLAGRRAVATNPPIDVGVADGQLVWAPHGKDAWAPLFPLEGDGAVEALRGEPLADGKGIVVAFRRAGAVWVGVARGDAALAADGGLVRIAGLGQVGSPSVASTGDDVVVAWADRAGASDDWQVRWSRFRPGGPAGEPRAFVPPAGGPGGQAMSPSVAGLGGGRFLLAWTEGPVASHQVRAMTIGADGLPSGSALALSTQGTNAGQPQVGIGPEGRGLVAFLASKGKGYELQAAAVLCVPR